MILLKVEFDAFYDFGTLEKRTDAVEFVLSQFNFVNCLFC